MFNYTILHHDGTRLSGECKNIVDLKTVVNAMNVVDPVKCCTIFVNDNGKFLDEE